MNEIHIKQIGKDKTKFSVNGKLCVISASGSVDNFTIIVKYHDKTTEFEREFLKKYLEVLGII